MRARIAYYATILLLVATLGLVGCSGEDSLLRKSWSRDFAKIGTSSSPRLADLDGDGVLDVVIGGAKKEFQFCDTAVIALNGKDGKLMWSASASDQIVGSASFVDITQNGLPDVIIGGRHAELIAIEGNTGRELWRYKTQDDVINTIGFIRFNFYNSQIIPDQNGDGIPDLLVANGGNVHAKPHNEKFRYRGVMVIINSKDGTVLHAASIPLNKETYMSPLAHDFQGNGNLSIIFGSGGETIPGNLYITSLEDLIKGDISGAKVLIEGESHGFIAPPALVDLNADGIKDIVANYHGGACYAVNGKTHEILWTVSVPGTEANSSLAIGNFNGDDTPDVFTHFNEGVWPENTGEVQLAIDGKNGEIIYRDSIGFSGMFSPLAVNVTGDERDEVLLDINELNYRTQERDFFKTAHYISVFNFENNLQYGFVPVQYCKNPASTPWVGDIDGDQKLDLVYIELTNTPEYLDFYGLRINRKATNLDIMEAPAWGAYMGTRYNAVYDQ